ncbi:MAG: hypothetical protein LM561_00400 [Desulfurococcaceae archaeon]|jgi:heme/copper-type cytochrome/quinol oxidase subunit 2|nr:hypothetical protein [Desulfurococcaceae archaeon]
MSSTSKARSKESLFVVLVLIIWALAFGVFLVNSANPTPLAGLSTTYTYSLLWWIAALLIFIGYAIYDVRRGG